MATGWMRGVVKEVPSGDTIIISAGAGKPGAAEKRLTLSSVVAPKLVRGRGRAAGACKGKVPCSCRRVAALQGLPPPWAALAAAHSRLIGAGRGDGGPTPPTRRHPPGRVDRLCPPALQARRDGTTSDEPFAWQSREFLRKLCIGKVRRGGGGQVHRRCASAARAACPTA